MDISKEIQIFNDLDINLDNLVNSTLDVFEDCVLIINLNNRTKLNKYVTEAINKKAKLIITSINCNVESERVVKFENYEDVFNHVIKKMYPEYVDKNFFGLTGTNGKTTTGYFLNQLLGEDSLFIGTTEDYLFKDITREEHLTTPKLFNIFKLLRRKEYTHINNIVLEVSSHALDQNRLKGMEFLVSGFTNLSQDHFDYHDNIDTYFDAKKKLFNKNLSKQYVFIDEDWGTRLNKEVNGESWSIGFKKENDMFIKEIKSSETNTLVSFKIDNHDYRVILPFIGPNCEMNYLLAVGMAHFSGTLSLDRILLETVNIKNPKGRFEKFSYLDNDVYVDYAHTPEAIDKAIEVVQEKYEKIIIVFGAGGNRDSYKRVNMGKAANKADHIIITNDNPRKEDPMLIAKEILEGVDLNKKVEIVLDRKAALKKGLDSLRGKSVLLVLGKGHESKQELKDRFVDFDDSVMISNLIEDMK